MASMTESQFKTFRADVRREVQSIAREIRSDIYNSVVDEARRVAAATARKHVEQVIRQEYIPSDLIPRLQNLEMQVTKEILKGMVSNPSIKIDEKGSITEFVPGKPKDWDTCSVNRENYTFFRGEWRRYSQMKEFARQACERHERAREDYRKAENALLASVEELRKITDAGF